MSPRSLTWIDALRSLQATGWLLFSLLPLAAAPDPAVPPGSAPPPIPLPAPASAPGGEVKIGDVSVDARQRELSFPATVNLRSGAVEYLVVTADGKVHESVFRTDVRPHQIQVALLLLGARGSTHPPPEDPGQAVAGERIRIEVSWPAGRRSRRRAVEQFVTDRKTGRAMSRGPWAYTGSRLREDGFAAERDGSIVSLITDPDALVNNPRRGREDDDNWGVRPRGLPAVNSPVTVTFRLMK